MPFAQTLRLNPGHTDKRAQLHSRCKIVVDEAAASKLEGADYYRWIFANEPEWKEYQ